MCGGEGEEGGGGGVKEERLGSYVYVGGRGRWGERRDFISGGGGVKIFWKSGGICMARGDLSYAFTRGACSPEKIFKNGATLPENFSTPLKFLNPS